jgi:hypothetical protein
MTQRAACLNIGLMPSAAHRHLAARRTDDLDRRVEGIGFHCKIHGTPSVFAFDE